jgi:hypothetical protein
MYVDDFVIAEEKYDNPNDVPIGNDVEINRIDNKIVEDVIINKDTNKKKDIPVVNTNEHNINSEINEVVEENKFTENKIESVENVVVSEEQVINNVVLSNSEQFNNDTNNEVITHNSLDESLSQSSIENNDNSEKTINHNVEPEIKIYHSPITEEKRSVNDIVNEDVVYETNSQDNSNITNQLNDNLNSNISNAEPQENIIDTDDKSIKHDIKINDNLEQHPNIADHLIDDIIYNSVPIENTIPKNIPSSSEINYQVKQEELDNRTESINIDNTHNYVTAENLNEKQFQSDNIVIENTSSDNKTQKSLEESQSIQQTEEINQDHSTESINVHPSSDENTIKNLQIEETQSNVQTNIIDNKLKEHTDNQITNIVETKDDTDKTSHEPEEYFNDQINIYVESQKTQPEENIDVQINNIFEPQDIAKTHTQHEDNTTEDKENYSEEESLSEEEHYDNQHNETPSHETDKINNNSNDEEDDEPFVEEDSEEDEHRHSTHNQYHNHSHQHDYKPKETLFSKYLTPDRLEKLINIYNSILYYTRFIDVMILKALPYPYNLIIFLLIGYYIAKIFSKLFSKSTY